MKQLNWYEYFKQLQYNLMIVDIDPDFTIIEMTNSNLLSVGVTREQIAGNPLFTVFPDTVANNYTEADWVKKSLEKVIATNKMVMTSEDKPLRYDIADKDGKLIPRYWHIINSPYFDAKGKLYAITVMGLDVTDMMEQKLKI